MKKIATLAAVVALTLTGCATTSSTGTTEDKSGTNATSPEPATEDTATEDTAEEDTAEEQPADDGTASFGEPYEWEDGLLVKVSKPKPYNPSDYAVTGKGNKHVVFDVKIVNNTGAPFDASLFSTTMQSGNTEAEEIFDSAKGLEGAPMTKVLDGRETKFQIGYTVTNPKDLVLEVSPSYEYDSVLYTS